MTEDTTAICDECRSSYVARMSQMDQLCPECAHWLYGYPLCEHSFTDDRCAKCGWDGSRTKFINALIEQAKRLESEKPNSN